MAQKKASEKTDLKPVRLDLDPESHRQLRIVAAAAGVPMAIYCRDLVAATVRAESAKLTRRKGSGRSVIGG